MGLFNKKEKKIIAEISRKNKIYYADIEKEINELMEDLKHEFHENRVILEEFSNFIDQIKDQLSEEDKAKLVAYYNQVSKMKSCAKKGIEALHYLSREHQKLSKENLLEHDQYLS